MPEAPQAGRGGHGAPHLRRWWTHPPPLLLCSLPPAPPCSGEQGGGVLAGTLAKQGQSACQHSHHSPVPPPRAIDTAPPVPLTLWGPRVHESNVSSIVAAGD